MKKSFLRLPGLLSVVVLFLFTTCKKEDHPLPAATQEGANTFGCKVNGETWIPNGGSGFMGYRPIEGGFYGITNSQIGIYLRAHSKDGSMIRIFLNDYKIGTYQLNQDTNIMPFTTYPKDYALYGINEGKLFVTNSKMSGTVKILRSGPNIDGILSGTFSFTASNSSTPTQTFRVTDGRFDINVRTLK